MNKNIINHYYNILKETINKYSHIILPIIIFLFLTISTLSQIYPTVFFFPIDGNYQNYNVVRRLLDGQIPFKDFVVYLGPLHLYLGSAVTKLLGNNFVSSVLAYNILTKFIFLVFIIFLLKILKYSFKSSCLIILAICLLYYTCHSELFNIFVAHGNPEKFRNYSELISLFFEQGNSARFIRASSLIFLSLYIYFIGKYIKKEAYLSVFYGLGAGFAIPCSNDYGLASAFSLFILFCYLQILSKKNISKKIKYIALYIVACSLGGIISTYILSQGHIIDWANQIRNIGSYQYWYYLGIKSAFIYDFNIHFPCIVQILFTIYLFIQIYKNYKNNQTEDYLLYNALALLNLTACIVTQEIQFFSNGYYLLPSLILYTTFVLYILKRLNETDNPKLKESLQQIKSAKEHITAIFVVIFVVILIISTTSITSSTSEKYITELGGTPSNYSEDILDAKNFINGKKIFSTYASALEDITNQFQPSGYDYIIHALGDDARQKYIKHFEKEDFSYATIQKTESTEQWENWIQNQNHFFYRILYRYYIPIYTNQYLTILKKTNKDNMLELPANTKITTLPLDKKSRKTQVYISTAKYVNGIADLYIDYEIKEKYPILKYIIFKKVLKINDVFEIPGNNTFLQNYQCHKNNMEPVPVKIINGSGSIILSTIPNKDVKLIIKDLHIKNYYETPFKYIEIKDINYNQNKVSVDKNYLNLILLNNKKSLSINDKKYNIANITLGSDSINIQLSQNLQEDNTNYFIEIDVKE